MRANGWQGCGGSRRCAPRSRTRPRPGRRTWSTGSSGSTTPPNRLVVADFTYVRLATGVFVYTAFAIDAFAGRIVGWECSTSKETAFVESAIRQAAALRQREGNPLQGETIHYSDAGQLRSVPFGKYCRSRPLVFSSVPRCQGAMRIAEVDRQTSVDALRSRCPWRLGPRPTRPDPADPHDHETSIRTTRTVIFPRLGTRDRRRVRRRRRDAVRVRQLGEGTPGRDGRSDGHRGPRSALLPRLLRPGRRHSRVHNPPHTCGRTRNRSSSLTATTTPSCQSTGRASSSRRWSARRATRSCISSSLGAQHSFDLFRSIRNELVVKQAVDSTPRIRARRAMSWARFHSNDQTPPMPRGGRLRSPDPAASR